MGWDRGIFIRQIRMYVLLFIMCFLPISLLLLSFRFLNVIKCNKRIGIHHKVIGALIAMIRTYFNYPVK